MSYYVRVRLHTKNGDQSTINYESSLKKMSGRVYQNNIDRRPKEGRSNKEIQCCLKRYVARELYQKILNDLTSAA
jgi:hypothetical protein